MASFTGTLTDVQAPAIPSVSAPSASNSAASGDTSGVGLFSGLLNVGLKGVEAGINLADDFAVKDFTREITKIQGAVSQGAISGPEGTAQASALQRTFLQSNPGKAKEVLAITQGIFGKSPMAEQIEDADRPKKMKMAMFEKTYANNQENGLVNPVRKDGTPDIDGTIEMNTRLKAHEKQVKLDKDAVDAGRTTLTHVSSAQTIEKFDLAVNGWVSKLATLEKLSDKDFAVAATKLETELAAVKRNFYQTMVKEISANNAKHWTAQTQETIEKTVNSLFGGYEAWLSGDKGVLKQNLRYLTTFGDQRKVRMSEASPYFFDLSQAAPELQKAIAADTLATDPSVFRANVKSIQNLSSGKPVEGPLDAANNTLGVSKGKITAEDPVPDVIVGQTIKTIEKFHKEFEASPTKDPKGLLQYANTISYYTDIGGRPNDPKQLEIFVDNVGRGSAISTVKLLDEGGPKQKLLGGILDNISKSITQNIKAVPGAQGRVVYDYSTGTVSLAPIEGGTAGIGISQAPEVLRAIDAVNKGIQTHGAYKDMVTDKQLRGIETRDMGLSWATETGIDVINGPEEHSKFSIGGVLGTPPSTSNATPGETAGTPLVEAPASTTGADYEKFIPKEITKYGTDLGKLVLATIKAESAFNKNAEAVARDGKIAHGYMQVQEPTAMDMAKRLKMTFDVNKIKEAEVNIPLGSEFVRVLDTKYEGDVAKVVAGYNMGPAKLDEHIKKYKGNWYRKLDKSVRKHVDKVLGNYDAE